MAITSNKGIEGIIDKQDQIYLDNYLCVVIYNGEGNGTPLQYSCLENPMDGGAR